MIGTSTPYSAIDALQLVERLRIEGFARLKRIGRDPARPEARARLPAIRRRRTPASPSSDASPLPRPRFGALIRDRFRRREHLAREREVRLRAAALGIEENDRLAERRRFGETHVARNVRLEDLLREIALQFVEHFDRETRAAVEHRDEHAADVQRRIERVAHAPDHAGELRRALRGRNTRLVPE